MATHRWSGWPGAFNIKLGEWIKNRRIELKKENRHENRKRLSIKYRLMRKLEKRLKVEQNKR